MLTQFQPDPKFVEHLQHAREGEWMPCPRCGSARTRYRSTLGVAAVMVAAGAVMIWVWWGGGLLYRIIGIILGLLIGGALPAYAIRQYGRGVYSCADCKFDWRWDDVVKAREGSRTQRAAEPN